MLMNIENHDVIMEAAVQVVAKSKVPMKGQWIFEEVDKVMNLDCKMNDFIRLYCDSLVKEGRLDIFKRGDETTVNYGLAGKNYKDPFWRVTPEAMQELFEKRFAEFRRWTEKHGRIPAKNPKDTVENHLYWWVGSLRFENAKLVKAYIASVKTR